MKEEKIKQQIIDLEKRRDMAQFQRKITTEFFTVMEYDEEISAIDIKLELLQYDLKKSQR